MKTLIRNYAILNQHFSLERFHKKELANEAAIESPC